MVGIFYCRPGRIIQWFNAKGYSGTLDEMAMAYFSSLSGLSRGTVVDHISKVLSNLGFNQGELGDQLTSFFQSMTGHSSRIDAEFAFWGNTSSSFFDPNIITDTDGNFITDTGGNIVTDTD